MRVTADTLQGRQSDARHSLFPPFFLPGSQSPEAKAGARNILKFLDLKHFPSLTKILSFPTASVPSTQSAPRLFFSSCHSAKTLLHARRQALHCKRSEETPPLPPLLLSHFRPASRPKLCCYQSATEIAFLGSTFSPINHLNNAQGLHKKVHNDSAYFEEHSRNKNFLIMFPSKLQNIDEATKSLCTQLDFEVDTQSIFDQ